MEQLLKKKSMRLTCCALDKQEECPISGEYTLPEYCPDVAVILKCFAYPHIQNRQWSGDQWLLDGTAVIRVLYLDEERRCLRSLEFTQSFSCTMRGEGRADNAAVQVELSTKYLSCRAVSPRRVEVRGAILVQAYADVVMQKDVAVTTENDALHTRTESLDISVPCGACDKVLTVSESLSFHESLPPAEMLLGGECRAIIRECKVLMGKAIVKGQVFVHQLYVDSLDGGSTHCLEYALPFSQIMDVDDALEGMPYYASVHVLSDTERCSVGPDGENTMLDISVKLLLQIQVYRRDKLSVLRDAYHSRYPLSLHTEEMEIGSLLGTRWEETVLPMQLTIPSGQWQEIVDVCIQPQECVVECNDDRADINGRMIVCVVACDGDGELVYHEFVEDYGLEYPSIGNRVRARVMPTTMRYRVVEDKLEIQASVCVEMTDFYCDKKQVISDLRLQQEMPYPQQKVTALLYYADAGETVWNIGRVCRTSPTCIMEENALTDECLEESKILVVPIIN